MTSELSDALNPHAIPTRSRQSAPSYVPNFQPIVRQPQEYVPHRSELELAIAEPPPPPPQPHPRPRTEGINAVQEVLRVIAASREAAEIERKRRLAWEQEQEAKYLRQQAEMERRVLDMQQEIASLKAYISLFPAMAHNGASSSMLGFPPYNHMNHASNEYQTSSLSVPMSPVSQPSSNVQQATFVEGCSSRPSETGQTRVDEMNVYSPEEEQDGSPAVAPSPDVTQPEGEDDGSPSTSSRRRKRTSAPPTDADDEESGEESSGSPPPDKQLKRKNHHDKRCLTIQHAMRLHIIRTMGLETDERLPEPHFDGAPLPDDAPVRFIWDKTVKQSAHNLRMRRRVIEDIKANRKLYKHVPEKDFEQKVLEFAFDQAYTTFRQKYRAQTDASAAVNHRMKENNKALKVRRLSRKKTKLNNRVDTRKRIEAFAHPTFDAALQIECMSSEESCDDLSRPRSSRTPRSLDRTTVLRIRGLPWRSGRLLKFYTILDEDNKVDLSTKPKRGLGRKERCLGPHKDGFFMPPKGVAGWMISKQWLQTIRRSNPDFLGLLDDIVVDPPGFDWTKFHGLGPESEDESEIESYGHMHGQHYTHHHHSYDPSSSLQYALTPVN